MAGNTYLIPKKSPKHFLATAYSLLPATFGAIWVVFGNGAGG